MDFWSDLLDKGGPEWLLIIGLALWLYTKDRQFAKIMERYHRRLTSDAALKRKLVEAFQELRRAIQRGYL